MDDHAEQTVSNGLLPPEPGGAVEDDRSSSHVTEADDEVSPTCRADFTGYNLVILVCSTMCLYMTATICYTVGVYYAEWMDYFDRGSGIVSWLGSVNLAMITLVAPITGYFTDRYGFRPMVMIGGLIATLGLVSAAFATDIYTLLITYSIIAPAGAGLMYVPALSIVPMYFTKGSVIATAISAAGAGLGNFIMPYVLQAAIDTFHWRGAMFVCAGFVVHICVFGALMREPKTAKQMRRNRKEMSGNMAEYHLKLYKNAGFVTYLIFNVLASAGLSVVLVHVTAITQALGNISRAEANIPVSCFGLANLCGRVFFGLVGQHKQVDTYLMFTLATLISGLSAILVPFLSNYPGIITWSLIFGILVAPVFGIMPVMVLHFVEMSLLNTALSHCCIFISLGFVIGAPIAGWIYDFTNDYRGSFYVGGTFILVGSLLLLIPYLVSKKERNMATESVDVDPKMTSLSLGSLSYIGSPYLTPQLARKELSESDVVNVEHRTCLGMEPVT